jgi:acyl carrier protein
MTIALDDLMIELERLSDETELDPDVPIIDLPIDSLVLIEWLYSIEEASGVPMLEVCLACDDFDWLSVRTLYSHIINWPAANTR